MPKPFQIEIELPIERDVCATGRVRHVHRSATEYIVGVHFEAFRANDQSSWYSYIDSLSKAQA